MSAEVARPRQLAPIEHPISRIGNPQNLDVRGFSRDGNRILESRASSGRPLANEGKYEKRRTESRRSSRQGRSVEERSQRIEAIPEGVEVVKADPGKTTLPLFGSKSQIENRAFSRLSQTSRDSQKRRLEIDELEHLLKEKGKHGFNEIKKRFIANDPEQKGNVSREGLQKILVDMLKKPISSSQLEELLIRLGLERRRIISYTEFGARFRDASSPEQPRYVDPVQRHWQERGVLKASEVHEHLKERAKQNVMDVVGLIPQHNPDGSRYILKPEFKNVLNSLGLSLENEEFDKLWKRYDPYCKGTIDGKYLMKELGIEVGGSIDTARSRESSRSNLLKKESDRQRSIDIEKWLKRKFREGFIQMRKDFEAKDKDCIDIVTHKDFISVLKKYGLNLEIEYLDEFLARCAIEPKKAGVPYKEFLLKFQDRSEEGMSHQILTNTNHKYNRPNSPSNLSSLSAIEARLLSYFQKDFLALLGTFHKIDKLSQDSVSQEEFRAAIESRFEIEMTDEQFRLFIDKVPLDEEGNVKYAEFMAQFDTEGPSKPAPSLFGPKRAIMRKYKPIGVLPADPTPPPSAKAKPFPRPIGALPRDPSPEGVDKNGFLEEEDSESLFEVPRDPRSEKELFKILKELMKNRYQDVERVFFEIDELNTRRMSQDTLYQLLKKLKIDPIINRAEIRSIWKSLITNTDNTLDFLQFARHFGYSLKSAAFPNAKIQPPRKGDSDLMMRSRKLNCAADMLMDSLRSKIDYMWEDIRKEFEIMDPYKTGLVSIEEFRDVMTELCVHLSNYELDILTKKYSTDDGRVSYVELLKPFALKRQIWRHGNNMLSLLQFPHSDDNVYRPPQRGMDGVTAKLRQKLSSDWKTLRQAFRKLDTNKTGYLNLAEFKSVLKLVNVILDEEEIYQIMSEFDENLSGKIPYKQFINKALPEACMSRMSSRQSVASSRKSANF